MNGDMGGCGLYRQLAPHMTLARNHKDVKVTFTEGLEHFEALTGEKLSSYDIVQYHKGFYSESGLARARREGLITIVDFDDYWHVPYGHLLYKDYKRESVPRFFENQLKFFDHVTVTTKELAKAVKPFNSNVHVLPNAIDPDATQFKINKVPSGKLRFGWIGGVCHLPDMELMKGINNRLANSDIKDKYSFSLFGYQRGTIFDNYCDVLTDRGKWVKNFHLYPSEGAERYTLYYNLIDVALVPLVDNRFNNLKSELKLIEAGFFKKATIVSDVMPYSPLIQHGENCLKVSKPGDWFKHMKYLINNPKEVTRLGNNLYDTVKDRFNQNTVSEDRYKLYKCLITTQSKQRGAA